ncbi:MAG: efflux RND transporter periplasmic adaptor subunit, partial [Desulfobacteraceae bacterium]
MKRLPGGKKTVLAIFGLVVILLLGYRLLLYRPSVPVMVVKQREVQGQVKGPGTVQSKVPVTVSTKITGIVEKLYADQGDRVKKDQLLAELDAAELRARAASSRAGRHRAQRELRRAQAEVAKAQANLELARSNYRRDLEVFKPGYISGAAMDTTRAQLRLAESEQAAAQAQLAAQAAAAAQAESEVQASEALLGYTKIPAPMDGLITVREAEVGSTVSPGEPIFQMVDLDTIWIAAWIDASQIAPLAAGQKAAIRLRSGRHYQGQVARLNREADTVTRELQVDVKLDTLPDPLVIGEEAEVTIATGRQQALAVPLAAIVSRREETGVMAAEQGRLAFRPVTVGLNDGQKVAVLEGLQEGELVVPQPVNLQPGSRVKPVVQSPAG